MTFLVLMSALATIGASQAQPYPSSAELVAEINAVRTDPVGYTRHLREYRARYQGLLRYTPGEVTIRTQEGVRAVDEAIAALMAQAPVTPLRRDSALDLAAADHVFDQGPGGLVSHQGTDGSSPTDRGRRRGVSTGVGENIAFGQGSARDVVIQLLVDDGVPGRGHRINIFRSYSTIGAACGPHTAFRQICVLDFAL